MKSAPLVVLVVMALASCAKSNYIEPHQREAATLAEEKMCAEGATKSFTHDTNAFRDTYTNHYDPASRTCYVESTTASIISTAPYRYTYSHTVYDAFEGRVYGEYDSLSDKEEPDSCKIEPRNQQEIICKSREEFDQLALRYFGTTSD